MSEQLRDQSHSASTPLERQLRIADLRALYRDHRLLRDRFEELAKQEYHEMCEIEQILRNMHTSL